jgi:hypothetical protein
MKNMVTKHTKLIFTKLNLNYSFNQTLKFQLRTVVKSVFHKTFFFQPQPQQQQLCQTGPLCF